MDQVKIAPSLLAADFANLAEEVARIEAHVDMLHLDIMDGHFVPNISFGMPVIESLRPHTRLIFDCHMMTTNPDLYFEDLKNAGGDLAMIHIEAVTDPTEAAARAREAGLGFGLVVNPPTPIAAIEPFVELCDMVLVMSVHPGFGGQVFIPEALEKTEAARKWVDEHGLSVDIQIDGGINPETARLAREAGANVFVAGTAIFRADDPVIAVERLRQAIDGRDV
ncbi:MAG: ribulose-phosphate 3-epimerase [Acidimicrobiia bacterium]|nr:ribulose-phosphate 3-epimerase [Acidimicrobiia bacterium]